MIRIKDLTFGYSKKASLFKGLSLELPPGHIYGLFGKNGAGKSTLLKSIGGLLFPDEGSCKIAAYDAKLRRPGMLRQFFMVPEEFYLPGVGVESYLRTYAPFYPAFNRQEFEHYLEEFDVDRSGHLSRLSYGQKKKVLISFGLATNTPILLLDEPTNGLDIPSKSIFRKLVASAFNENRTIVIATHQVRDLDNLIDTMIILHDHNVKVNASIEHILSRIAFRTVPENGLQEEGLQAANEVLYMENTLKGRNIILENKGGELTKMNMEMFFNAVTGSPRDTGGSLQKIMTVLN